MISVVVDLIVARKLSPTEKKTSQGKLWITRFEQHRISYDFFTG